MKNQYLETIGSQLSFILCSNIYKCFQSIVFEISCKKAIGIVATAVAIAVIAVLAK